MQNKLTHFFLIISLLFSSMFVTASDYDEILDICQNNYETVIGGTILGAFITKKKMTEKSTIQIFRVWITSGILQ